MGRDAAAELTARECEVLELLSQGRANKDIAEALDCSVRTVEFHISNLLRKVGASSRLELVARRRADSSPGLKPNHDAPLIEIRVLSGVAAAAIGDTIVTMWSAPASPERWRWTTALIDELLDMHESGVQMLSLIADTSSPPDGALRAQMKLDFARLGSRLKKFVAVPLGNSIWMGVVRMIGNAVLLFRGQSDRHSVAASVEQGLSRILAAPGPSTPSRAELEHAIAELSRLLGVSSPALNALKTG
jgi:DNA-binding CsgD family transcriptional regulator